MFNPSVAYSLGAIAALVCAILTVIMVTPASKHAGLPPFFKVLSDIFNFKGLFLEKIFKFCYILSTYSAIFVGFFMIFSGYDSYWGGYQSYAGYGILMMIVGPIACRITFEFLMLIILLVKNVIEINNKLSNGAKTPDIFSQPIYTAPAEKNDAE